MSGLGGHGPRSINPILADTEELISEQAHVTHIFPATTNLTCTLTAHANANTWDSWAEPQDSAALKFSDCNLTIWDLHLTAIMIEWSSVIDKLYMIEMAYSDPKINFARVRLTSGDKNFLPPIQYMRIRAADIPYNEKIYYRMMCETGGATCRVSFRYHYHD